MVDIAKETDRTGSESGLRSLTSFFRPHLGMVFSALATLVLTACVR
jgi:hypothetical protein